MDALHYAQNLVAFDSTSSLSNAAVSDYVEDVLRKLGFTTERIEYRDPQGVRKINILGKKGNGTGGIGYFGHTDVVPADDWAVAEHRAFQPTVRDDRLYGRGSCDMKGSVACMLAAAGGFPTSELTAPIYVTCTADEEVGYGGAAEVVRRSELYREMVAGGTKGIIGEPTRLEVVHAHKGTYSFRAVSQGRAAHSSTGRGVNANLVMIPFLAEMKRLHDETERDPHWHHPEFDPPTLTWNIGINDHTRAINITPPQSICTVAFRPMPGQNADDLLDRAAAAAERCGLAFEITCQAGPLYSDPQSEFIRDLLHLSGNSVARTVPYGTDGVMFTELREVAVFGPGDIVQAHTHDEWIALEQLQRGTELYARLIRHWCC